MAKRKKIEKLSTSLQTNTSHSLFIKYGRVWLGLIGLLFCMTIISTADFSNLGLPAPRFNVERAVVHQIFAENLIPDSYLDNLLLGSQMIEIEVLSGEFSGQRIIIENSLQRFANVRVEEGMQILVSIVPGLEQLEIGNINVHSHSRAPVLMGAIILLLISMLIMGGQKGLYAMTALVFTLIVVIYFLIEAIIRGQSPVLYALLTAFITTGFTLLMIGGFSRQSIAAVGGTWTGLLIAGLLSAMLGQLANVSGMHLEHARQMIFNTPPNVMIQVPDLLFAAIVVAASGAVVDAAMSISSSVFEIKEQSPTLTAQRLYRSGIRIGRDILGANSNTLILAFVGSSLTTIILVALFNFPFLRLVNLDMVAIEIVQGVSATMGMIIAIPATAFFSSLLATRGIPRLFKRNH